MVSVHVDLSTVTAARREDAGGGMANTRSIYSSALRTVHVHSGLPQVHLALMNGRFTVISGKYDMESLVGLATLHFVAGQRV